MEIIYATGGEPLLLPHLYKLLNVCYKEGYASKISLRFTTNGTLINEEFLHLAEKFQQTQLIVSLDGVGDVQEYIRYPLKWETFDQNVRSLGKLPWLNLKFASCLQTYNALNFDQILQYLFELYSQSGKEFEFHAILLQYPEFLDVRSMPDIFKKEVFNKIQHVLSAHYDDGAIARYRGTQLLDEDVLTFRILRKEAESVLRWLSVDVAESDIKWSKFKKYTQVLDRSRKVQPPMDIQRLLKGI